MKAVVVAVALLALLFLFVPVHSTSHGHSHELLVITVSLVDRDTGKPLGDSVAATIQYESALAEYDFASHLAEALGAAKNADDEGWRKAPFVCAARTTGAAETTIRSRAYVTRYYFDTELTDTNVSIPALLLVDHPNHGRTLIPMDSDAAVEQDTDPPTWRLDLGTVVIPAKLR